MAILQGQETGDLWKACRTVNNVTISQYANVPMTFKFCNLLSFSHIPIIQV
jgi:hypothetical protein